MKFPLNMFFHRKLILNQLIDSSYHNRLSHFIQTHFQLCGCDSQIFIDRILVIFCEVCVMKVKLFSAHFIVFSSETAADLNVKVWILFEMWYTV